MSLTNDHWDAWITEQWLKEQEIDKKLAETKGDTKADGTSSSSSEQK